MKKFLENHKFGASLLLGLLAGVIIVHISGGCPVYRTFHIECLGCGMTHAVFSALKLDFKTAFHYHPMFWSVPIIALFVLFEGKLFKKKALNILLVVLLFAGFVAQYVLKYKGFV